MINTIDYDEFFDIKPGCKSDDYQCATYQNNLLRKNGYNVYGDAWNLNGVKQLYTGYDTSKKPKSYNGHEINKYNNDATTRFRKEFDSKTMLDTKKTYVANMVYKGSSYQKAAYEQANSDAIGTHTGVVYWDDDKEQWRINHSIQGKVYDEKFTEVQGPNRKWSVTTVYEPKKNTLLDNVKIVIKKFMK